MSNFQQIIGTYFPFQINRRNVLAALAITLGATVVSIMATGFRFGVNNNVFHIPYVLRYSELQVFYSDVFYNSLDKFTSVVWPFLRLVSTEQNIKQVFFISHFLSRALAFIALAWFFYANGVAKGKATFIALITAAVCPWLMGASVVGGHGLFISYFTHSEATWGPLIAALVAAQLGRLGLAAIFSGLVFSINAFVGLWLIIILAVTVLGNSTQRRDWRLLATSAFAFLFVSAPVAIWIAFSIKGKVPAPEFSYIEYIRAYSPGHFLIEAAGPFALRNLAIVSYCGFVSAFLSTNRKFWLSAFAACVALFLAGAILPYLINHRFIFNLHLLRADGVLQFLALILSISVSVRILFERRNTPVVPILAALSGVSLMTPEPEPLSLLICAISLSLLAMIRLFESLETFPSTLRIFLSKNYNYAVGLLVFLATAIELFHFGISFGLIARWILIWSVLYTLTETKRSNPFVVTILWTLIVVVITISMVRWKSEVTTGKADSKNSALNEMKQWVHHSQLSGPFLFPVDPTNGNMFNEFQLHTQKTVWVDWKQGAAVMWEPSFYWQWMPRFNEVNALRTPDDFAAYGVKMKIPYFVLPIGIGKCPSNTNIIFENPAFSICSPKLN